MRLSSTACTTQVVVVRAPADDIDLRCGGHPLQELDAAGTTDAPAGPDAAWADGTQLGKRYVDTAGTVELLCSRRGDGSLAIGDVGLVMRGAEPLPASD
jgi:hypothetical protein